MPEPVVGLQHLDHLVLDADSGVVLLDFLDEDGIVEVVNLDDFFNVSVDVLSKDVADQFGHGEWRLRFLL